MDTCRVGQTICVCNLITVSLPLQRIHSSAVAKCLIASQLQNNFEGKSAFLYYLIFIIGIIFD